MKSNHKNLMPKVGFELGSFSCVVLPYQVLYVKIIIRQSCKYRRSGGSTVPLVNRDSDETVCT